MALTNCLHREKRRVPPAFLNTSLPSPNGFLMSFDECNSYQIVGPVRGLPSVFILSQWMMVMLFFTSHNRGKTNGSSKHTAAVHCAVAKFIASVGDYIVHSGITLSCRPANLCSLAGRSQLYPPSQRLWIWLQYWCGNRRYLGWWQELWVQCVQYACISSWARPFNASIRRWSYPEPCQ